MDSSNGNTPKRIDHLKTLSDLIRSHCRNKNCFDILYQQLETEYFYHTSNTRAKRLDYIIDLDSTMSKYAKKFIHKRSNSNYRLFVYFFESSVQKEIDRIMKATAKGSF